MTFLVDTGSEVSLLPATPRDRRHHRLGPRLVAANGSAIASFGFRHLSMRLGSRKLRWRFIIADVASPILGADFLRSNNLLVDVRNRRLLDSKSLETINTRQVSQLSPSVSLISVSKCPLANILSQYPRLTEPKFSDTMPKHGVEHYIHTTGPPVHARARRLSTEKLAAAKAEFEKMEEMGIVRKSCSPWASPLHLVRKPDGSWRPCGDFRRLNCKTVPDRYTIPHIQDLTCRLFGKTIFSKIDLVRGYHQVPVHFADVPKTAVITPFGLFEYTRMPFGLCNSGQTFQRLMDSVCRGLDFLFVYLDDILIASSNMKEHQQHLRALFDRLMEHGLIVKKEKCIFGVSTIDFLGHRISAEGITPLPDKVRVILDFPRPITVKELQRYVGILNFYHRFLPRAASLMRPLYSALQKKPSASKRLTWCPEMSTAFDASKRALAEATMLSHPQAGAELALTTDASDFAVGGVLEQKIKDCWVPLGFFSRQLRDRELKYSTFDRELLAMYLSVRHFRHWLDGRNFVIFTDHNPLPFAMWKSSDPWTSRQQNQLSAISEFTTDIRHVSGKSNAVADALSRISVSAVSLGIDFRKMAAEQQTDAEVKAQRTAITNLKLKDVLIDDDIQLLCDVSTSHARPIVPASMRRLVFDTVHGLSHPGVRTTRKLVTEKFVWHGVSKDVSAWTKHCLSCQKAKIQTHVRSPIEDFEPPNRRFDHVHIDVVGPLPVSQGFKYLLTIVDRFTRWPEAIPLKETTTTAIASAFVYGWVARFGTPSEITSDRGPQFTSAMWSALAKLLGSTVTRTTAFHPQANGIVERFHRNLKDALRSRLIDGNWYDQLPWVLLGIRTAPKRDLGVSSAELVYGDVLSVPGDLLAPTTQPFDVKQQLHALREKVAAFRPVPMSRHGSFSFSVPRVLQTCKYVFVRKDSHRPPLSPPYSGPFEVIHRDSKLFLLKMGNRQEKVTIDRLKPAHVDPDSPVQTAAPPRRGRPPKRHN